MDIPGTAARSSVRTLPKATLAVVGWAAAFVAFGFVGRATIIDDQALSLVWPAAGIATLWVATGWGRRTPVDLLVLSACAFTVNRLTGAPADLALVFVVVNALQAVLVVFLARRAVGHLALFGGTEPLARVRDLGRFSAVTAGCTFVTALLGSAGLWLTLGAEPQLLTLALWWGRNAVGLIAVVVLFLLLQPDQMRSMLASSRARTDDWSPGLRLVEATALLLATGALYAVVFAIGTARPFAFMLLAPTVWAGLRFAPPVVVVHGVGGGALAVIFTLQELGPFMSIASVGERALVAQIFVLMSVVTGLALAFSRSERDDAVLRAQRLERESAQRARLFSSVLKSMHEGIVVVDADDAIVVRNPAGRRLMGLGPQVDRVASVRHPDLIGLTRLDGSHVAPHELPHRVALTGVTVAPRDYLVRTADHPEGRILELSAQPIDQVSEDGRPLALVNYRDVTVDRQDRDNLASFAGVVAHDLLSPLTVVEGWTEALNDELASQTLTPSSGAAMTRRIQGAALHMRTFIGDLLDWTVSRGQSMTSTSVDISRLAREIAEMRRVDDSWPIVRVADDIHAWGDEVLLRQLLDNLIGNALKYVAPGVRPNVTVRGDQTPEGVVVEVCDNGIGIPPEQHERIFDTFHRAHAQSYRGTGLGLAICRQIVERHGGSIRVRGAATGGSCFVVTLPSVHPRTPSVGEAPGAAGATAS